MDFSRFSFNRFIAHYDSEEERENDDYWCDLTCECGNWEDTLEDFILDGEAGRPGRTLADAIAWAAEHASRCPALIGQPS